MNYLCLVCLPVFSLLRFSFYMRMLFQREVSATFDSCSQPLKSWLRAIFVLNIPCRAKSSREVTKEQVANLYHRNFTSAGYSASSVEKYHYPSDCHRRNRSNLLLIPGVLAVLQCRSLGVPDKVAKIIRNKVLVNDLFSCQNTSERLPF